MTSESVIIELFTHPEKEDETCENCNAGLAIGTFNLDEVETPLCEACSSYRDAGNDKVITPTNSLI